MFLSLRIRLLGSTLFLFGAFPAHSFCDVPPVRIVVSVAPMASIVSSIGGRKIMVSTLISEGGSLHSFELKPSQIRLLYSSDLLIFTNPKVEAWSENLDLSLKEKTLWLDSGKELTSVDVHAWLDPVTVLSYAEIITKKLCVLSSNNCEEFKKNTELVRSDLTGLDLEIQNLSSTWPTKDFIADHPSWQKFAERYGLNQVAVLRDTENRQVSPQEMVSIVKHISEKKVRLFLAEEGVSAEDNSFIKEAGLKIVYLNSVGRPNEDYFEFIRHNLNALNQVMKELK